MTDRLRFGVRPLLVAGVVLAACAHAPAKLDFGPRGRISDPQVVFDEVRARLDKVQSVQGEAKASIDSPEGGGKVDELIAAERPDKARLDATTLLGPVATFTTDGTNFALADNRNRRFFEGPATPDAIALLLPVRLPATELVSVLLGVPPLVDGARPTSLALDDARGAYVLALTAGERMLVDTRTLLPVEVDVAARPGLSAYRVTFGDASGELGLPKDVRLVSGDVTVRLSWRDRDVNPSLDAAMFAQAPPAGFQVVP